MPKTGEVNKAITTLKTIKDLNYFPDLNEALSIAIEIMEDYLCSACGQAPNECLCNREEY